MSEVAHRSRRATGGSSEMSGAVAIGQAPQCASRTGDGDPVGACGSAAAFSTQNSCVAANAIRGATVACIATDKKKSVKARTARAPFRFESFHSAFAKVFADIAPENPIARELLVTIFFR